MNSKVWNPGISSWFRPYVDWVPTVAGLALVIASVVLLVATYAQQVPFSLLEAVGAVTGAISVWLAAKEHIANWPIGLINSAAFLLLFWQIQLYGSMATQVPYLALGVYGWYQWLFGGQGKTELKISRLTWRALWLSIVIGTILTVGLTGFFQLTDDPAPFMDAFTTALSLVALYFLTVKVMENWWVWMAADVIFIILYASQALYLTAGLYVVFFIFCVRGYLGWRQVWQVSRGQIV